MSRTAEGVRIFSRRKTLIVRCGSKCEPVLLLVGDEDEPCLDVNLWIKRLMPVARLALLPGSGHAINLEEPASFNRPIGSSLPMWSAAAGGRAIAGRRSVGAGRGLAAQRLSAEVSARGLPPFLEM
jgi:hypothetical protein